MVLWLWVHWPWFVLALATVLELVSFFNKTKGDTITENVRAWLRGRDRPDRRVDAKDATGRPLMATAGDGSQAPVTVIHTGSPVRVGGVRLNTWRFYWLAAFIVWTAGHLLFGWWSS